MESQMSYICNVTSLSLKILTTFQKRTIAICKN